MISPDLGRALVTYARGVVEARFSGEEPSPPKGADEKRGAFVTIKTGERLRGCMGRPFPTQPLWKAVHDSALDAAFSDPRFPPLKKEELSEVSFEVSVLEEPRRYVGLRERLPREIEEKNLGVILRYGMWSGLLLPQVREENSLSGEEFLEIACQKAGLPFGSWKDPSVEVLVFGAEVFSEGVEE